MAIGTTGATAQDAVRGGCPTPCWRPTARSRRPARPPTPSTALTAMFAPAVIMPGPPGTLHRGLDAVDGVAARQSRQRRWPRRVDADSRRPQRRWPARLHLRLHDAAAARTARALPLKYMAYWVKGDARLARGRLQAGAAARGRGVTDDDGAAAAGGARRAVDARADHGRPADQEPQPMPSGRSRTRRRGSGSAPPSPSGAARPR